jgi:hypothetical protein
MGCGDCSREDCRELEEIDVDDDELEAALLL